jgi:hypothetical protein
LARLSLALDSGIHARMTGLKIIASDKEYLLEITRNGDHQQLLLSTMRDIIASFIVELYANYALFEPTQKSTVNAYFYIRGLTSKIFFNFVP